MLHLHSLSRNTLANPMTLSIPIGTGHVHSSQMIVGLCTNDLFRGMQS
jgi:hypothetical protein